jgi:translocation and assembly module TamA
MAGVIAASGPVVSAAPAEAPRADVRGVVDKALRAEIQQAIGRAPLAGSRIEARRRAREAADTAVSVLRSEGYYDSRVDADLGEGEAPQPFITVAPGPRSKISEPTIAWIGAAPDPQTASAASKAMALKPGGPGRAADVIAAEGRILARVQRSGYADAAATPREVIVDHSDLSMHPTFRIKAGPLVRFDGIKLVTSGRTNRKWVARLTPWKVGEVYRPDAVVELERRLNDTSVFAAAAVSLAPASEAVNGERPVVVTLADRPKGALELGASYSTSEGAGVNSRWIIYNRLGVADRLTNTLQYAQIDSRLQTELSLPDWRKPDETLKLTAALYREWPVAYLEYGVGLSGDLTHRYGKTSFVTFGASVDATDTNEEEQANYVTTSRWRHLLTFAVYGGFALDRSNDPLNPTKGWKLDARLQPTASLGDGSVIYLKGWAQAAGYLPLYGAGTVLAARVKLGSIFGGDIPLVPAPDRFYAGGGGSVRGYGYQGVGPRFTDNTPQGGTSLFESSFEVRQRVTNQWGVVAFVDAGSVSAQVAPDFTRPKFGAGLGVRYNLGFAPLRIDVATPLNPAKGDPVIQIYLSLGQSF